MFATLRQWIDDRPGLLFFFIGWLTTILVMPASVPPVTDSAAREREAHWMWSGVNPGGQLKGRDGVSFHWWYGVGQCLALIPGDFIVSKLRPQADAPGDETSTEARRLSKYVLVSYLTYPVINGWALSAAFAVLNLLGMTRRTAGLGTLALQFGTTHLWHCQNNQENPLILALTLASLAAVLRWMHEPKASRLRWAGLLLGWSMLIRLPNAALVAGVLGVPAVTAILLRNSALLRTWVIASVRDFLPVFLAVTFLDRVWHWWRFGSWSGTYLDLYRQYVKEQFPTTVNSFPFQGEFLDGFLGAAFSPGKSAFIYDPLLIVGVLAVVVGWRQLQPTLRATIFCAFAAVVVTWAGYARFYVWSGDPAWGNRYGATPVHWLALLALPAVGAAVAGTRRHWIQPVAAMVLVAAVLCQIVGLAYPAWVEMKQAGYLPTDYAVVGRDNPQLLRRHADTFRLGQRWANVGANLTGNFTAWGLDRTRDGQTVGLHGVMLVPFLPFSSLPRTVTLAVRVAWGVGCIILLAAGWIAVRKPSKSPPTVGGGTAT